MDAIRRISAGAAHEITNTGDTVLARAIRTFESWGRTFEYSTKNSTFGITTAQGQKLLDAATCFRAHVAEHSRLIPELEALTNELMSAGLFPSEQEAQGETAPGRSPRRNGYSHLGRRR
jgi:hypothetical protein